MIKQVRIEQGIHRLNSSLSSVLRIENGKILSAIGLLGITQYEDEVVFAIEKSDSFKLPQFIWAHYFAIVLEIEGGDDTVLVFEEKNISSDIGFNEISDTPKKVAVSETINFDVFNHSVTQTGSISITPESIVAGDKENFDIVYKVGSNGLVEGAEIIIVTPVTSWSSPFFDASKHVSVKSAENVQINSELSPFYYPHRGYIYKIYVKKGKLNFGDSITIKYTSHDGFGIKVQQYIEDKIYFLTLEDSNGSGVLNPVPLKLSAQLKVVAGEPKRFRIKTAQIIEQNRNIKVKVRVLDACFNPVENYIEDAELKIVNSSGSVVYCCDFRFTDSVCEKELCKLQVGMYIISVNKEGFEEENISILVSPHKTEELYYGEIHGHSGVSDGLFGMQDYFDYGKNIGMLDFCALSDHDWEIVEHTRNKHLNKLEALGVITEKMNCNDEFVSICGYEWMGEGGHINVYYLEDKNNEIYVGNISFLSSDKLYPSMKDFVKLYEGRDDVLMIPHFSHGFEYKYYDKNLQHVAEIYSQWGCSEEKCATINQKGAMQFLEDGIRFGFISGADSHHGMPGQTGYNSKYYMLCHREGLTGVFANALTRQNIFSAFKAKQTYATTGERILLNFEINGFAMGSELALDDIDNIEVHILVGGTRIIDKIEIISLGEVVWKNNSYGEILADFKVDLERTKKENEYYYLRVKQIDGNCAWSSPIWLL